MMTRLRGMSGIFAVAVTTALLTTGAGTASAGSRDVGSCPRGTASSYSGTVTGKGGQVDYVVCFDGGTFYDVQGTVTDATDDILCTTAHIVFIGTVGGHDFGETCGKGNRTTFETGWMMGHEPVITVSEIYVPAHE